MLVKSRSADEDDAFRSIHLRRGFERETGYPTSDESGERGRPLCSHAHALCVFKVINIIGKD